ncbi:MAG: hypothetical protein VB016_06270 [Methanomassiliicoccaceae archaeon]|nr:hypothetical protein [Methanomassiliicoccaceae archaeon]
MPEIIKVAGLSKSYGDFLAVDDVSFSVGENQLFAFLGPNGAGKSTTGDRASVFFSLMDALDDLKAAPMSSFTIAAGYLLSTFIIGLTMAFVFLILGEAFMLARGMCSAPMSAASGWC